MFFSGDSSTRKRVDLGGRSSKERDRKKLLEQTRLERERRMQVRAQNSAAIKIQKWFRGKRALQADRLRVRDQFFSTYGNHFEKVNRHCFSQESDFLRQLLYFVSPLNAADFSALLETCRILRQIVRDSGDILSLFSGDDYSSKHGVVDYRVKQFAYTCIRAIHQNRNQLKDQIFLTLDQATMPTVLLFGTVIMLIDPRLPWSCKIVGYLLKRNTYALLREIIFTGKESRRIDDPDGNISSLGSLLALFLSHVGQNSCVCPNIDPHWSFSSQILTIPFLWKLFPHLKEALATREMSEHYIHQMALCVKNHANVLPSDISAEFPSYACLLANLLETTGVTLSRSDCSFDMAIDFAAVATFLLEALPPMHSSYGESKEDSMMDEDGITTSNQVKERNLSKLLQEQISKAIDPKFLLQLTNTIFGGIPLINSTSKEEPRKTEVTAIGAACAFLHVTFNILPLERGMTVLAYRTELVPVLWNFMKQCHENQKWSDLSSQFSYAQGDAPGWLLPLSVFCPVYKHMLMIVDNEEFYEQEKPLSLNDIKCLIAILRQALWQLLWVNPGTPPDLSKSTSDVFDLKRHPLEFLQHRVSIVASDLLSQLQDWNNRKQFTLPTDFHADGVNDHFISQASVENTKAREILKHAPFLVPFTSRVKIFTTQLGSARHSDGNHMAYTRTRFRIRRDHILEDAFSQWSTLSEEGLRGPIRVTFVNEFGVEEAGIDGGGIFKDFMENITRAAFDMQYGLFKETSDHLLYPNPGSGITHELHLQFFHFLGTILGKAMFEGILVDIPFATFFLSKLKQKYNYLNDLPSLDPELYRHLIFLKRYEGDISELELYFVIVNNEYGEQIEEELLPGGKDMRVTNENVIHFIHLIANHRLNFQIRQQSLHFLRGFQQLVPTDWIDMFNEHELQLLISGSLDGFDLEDLRVHTNYSGGYHSEHYVIDMFWDVLKSLSMDSQMKFLKFVTGCSRGPLLGFKYLEPTFCIQRAAGSASEAALDRLPTSATCMNLLKLPPYRSKEQLKQKLMYAIDAEAGFDLS